MKLFERVDPKRANVQKKRQCFLYKSQLPLLLLI